MSYPTQDAGGIRMYVRGWKGDGKGKGHTAHNDQPEDEGHSAPDGAYALVCDQFPIKDADGEIVKDADGGWGLGRNGQWLTLSSQRGTAVGGWLTDLVLFGGRGGLVHGPPVPTAEPFLPFVCPTAHLTLAHKLNTHRLVSLPHAAPLPMCSHP